MHLGHTKTQRPLLPPPPWHEGNRDEKARKGRPNPRRRQCASSPSPLRRWTRRCKQVCQLLGTCKTTSLYPVLHIATRFSVLTAAPWPGAVGRQSLCRFFLACFRGFEPLGQVGILQATAQCVLLHEAFQILLDAKHLHNCHVGTDCDAGTPTLQAAQRHGCHSGAFRDLLGGQSPAQSGEPKALTELAQVSLGLR